MLPLQDKPNYYSMIKRLSIFVAALLMVGACCNDRTAQFDTISKEVKSEFASDRRSKTYEASLDQTDNGLVLRGVTTEVQAKEALLARLSDNGMEVKDSMVVLPHPSLGDKTWGITNLSVINIRMDPDYDAESGTQTLLGTILRVLENRGGWLRVQTPEGYLAWVTEGSVKCVTEAEAQEWIKSDRLIVNTHYTLLRDEPSERGNVVCDAVWGCIVKKISAGVSHYKVLLPNGKEAYLKKSDAQDFAGWVDSRNVTAESLIATAKHFLGFPYLWGGTSIKGMDCSGFVKTTYYLNGIILLRDASQQAYTGEEIDITNGLDNLKPGDLIFFGRKATAERKERVSHVGMYLGGGEFIHSATVVRINSLLPDAPNYYTGSTRLIRASRILGNVDNGKNVFSIKNHPNYF